MSKKAVKKEEIKAKNADTPQPEKPQMESPNNDKETQTKKDPEVKQMPPQATQKQPIGFETTMQGLNELADAINSVVANKYVKQTIFNALNNVMTPIFEGDEKDEENNKES